MTACCLIVFLCVFRGAKTVGKVSFVLVPLSFFLLAALLVRALSIPGATSGLAYFIYPNFYSLMSLTVSFLFLTYFLTYSYDFPANFKIFIVFIWGEVCRLLARWVAKLRLRYSYIFRFVRFGVVTHRRVVES